MKQHFTEPTDKQTSKRFWVYFRGTNNGEHIVAETMQSAKWILAIKHGLSSLSYIAGRKA